MNDKLQQALIEIVEALKSNSGPIAERLLEEYSRAQLLRACISSVFLCLGFSGLVFAYRQMKTGRRLNEEHKKEIDAKKDCWESADRGEVHYIVAGVTAGICFIGMPPLIIKLLSSTMAYAAPLYSLIKEIVR